MVTNINKYYPETDKTLKGHLNQTQKKNWYTKTMASPFEQSNTCPLQGKKELNIFVKIYNTHETTFSDQTVQFKTRSQAGNK